MILNYLHKAWQDELSAITTSSSFENLMAFLETEMATKAIYPPKTLVFNAFNLCLPEQIKVVLIGQDPYHKAGQANGLCFSVNDGIKFPPSLRNIFIELKTDVNSDIPFSGNLEHWAKQGVLMLNAVLTVENAQPASHKNKGWEVFTDAVISFVSKEKKDIVFLLWGNYAIEKETLIDASKHFILKAAHPSPLARGAYFGSKHFSKTNAFLLSKGLTPIHW